MPQRPKHGLFLPPVSPAASKPLYEQIIDGIKREVAAGRLRPHDALPSFRDLAETMLVSIITVKRVYEDLERERIIYRQHGVGTFVSEDAVARSRESHEQRAVEKVREALRACREAGWSDDDIVRWVRNQLK